MSSPKSFHLIRWQRRPEATIGRHKETEVKDWKQRGPPVLSMFLSLMRWDSLPSLVSSSFGQ
ncbi:hypothetical protein MUK42_34887 [Musa troglodytarum]|uniref:Uncharacterized protein n=1 Tax=Musa troglodytarum TaxID=320322 RepID=A0A9E7JC23_9LILI|nr:hypothetical protein MUK42_36593 [Musa troglodytarum]URD74957.1 hypothetical protein MUK42_34887 [Musa troglodytarum]